jgi:hypothetical protein
MSGGEGLLTLASSHALTSRMTPESGRGGRDGGWMQGVCEGRWKTMGIGGIGGTSSLDSAVTSLEGAVRGRLMVMRSRSPPSPPSPLGWIEGSFRRRRWIHCLAVSCLPAAVEDVFLVGGAVILTVLEGAAGEDIVR